MNIHDVSSLSFKKLEVLIRKGEVCILKTPHPFAELALHSKGRKDFHWSFKYQLMIIF